MRPALTVFQQIPGCAGITYRDDEVALRGWYIPAMSGDHTALPRTLLFFDGVCGLCNRFVDFLVRHDRSRALRYAPLQGETAATVPDMPRGIDSVVVIHDGQLLVRSDAAITALAALGGAWRLSLGLRLIPRPLRDAVYDFIARNRYAWCGRHDVCQLPDPHEARWFLP